MKSVDQLFAEEWASFSDVLLDITNQSCTEVSELKRIFECLPEHIRDTAHCWGLSDTPFRDDAFVWLRDHRAEWQRS